MMNNRHELTITWDTKKEKCSKGGVYPLLLSSNTIASVAP
jgi:hypothetical protein